MTYANVVMTLALVFAMSGGAYAASKYLITSTKQISPKVLKALKGRSGNPGATGATGLAGPTGPQGPQGTPGGAGNEGAAGAPGKEGKEGKSGKEGKEGQPWTAGGTLPVGSTETGTWAIRSTASAAAELRVTAVSFSIPLASPPLVTNFVKIGDPLPAACKGDATKPGAKSGQLCVFEAETPFHIGGLNFGAATNPDGTFNAGTMGAELVFTTAEPAKAGEEVSAEGSWAVTG